MGSLFQGWGAYPPPPQTPLGNSNLADARPLGITNNHKKFSSKSINSFLIYHYPILKTFNSKKVTWSLTFKTMSTCLACQHCILQAIGSAECHYRRKWSRPLKNVSCKEQDHNMNYLFGRVRLNSILIFFFWVSCRNVARAIKQVYLESKYISSFLNCSHQMSQQPWRKKIVSISQISKAKPSLDAKKRYNIWLMGTCLQTILIRSQMKLKIKE